MASAKAPLVDVEAGKGGVELSKLTPGNEGEDPSTSARDLIPTEDDDAPAVATAPPDKVTMKGPNGENEEIQVAPLFPCLGDGKAPPGGWYGPFGFLRVVCYVFLGIAFVGAILLVLSFFLPFSIIAIFQNLVLIPAALMCAAAAYSQEGLAKEVSKVAKANDSYSSQNDQFEEQLGQLGDVANKLEDMVKSGQANLEKLESVISGIERVSDLGKVNTIVRSFTDAEMREFMHAGDAVTKRLSNVAELKAFLEGCIGVLTHNIPSFDLKCFRKFGLRGGIDLSLVALMVAAVNTENMQEQASMVTMLFFILDPLGEGRKQAVAHELYKHMTHAKNHPIFKKYSTREAIDKELTRLEKTVPKDSAKPRIKESDATEFVNAVLGTLQVDDPVKKSKSVDVDDEASSDEDN